MAFASDLLNLMQRRRARRAMYNRTYAELSVLSNRDLDDLGIGRADIGRVAREAASGI